MDSTAKTMAHCEDCIPIPDAFPGQCALHLYEDAKSLFAGGSVADMQCTYMCAITLGAWAGRFVPTNGLDPMHPKMHAPSSDQMLGALQSAIDSHGENKPKRAKMEAIEFDWRMIARLVLEVLLKLVN